MSQSIQSRVNGEQVMDKITALAASATLKAYQTVVHVSDTAAVVVTLPPVAEAAGKIYTIYTVSAAGSNGVDVIDGGDALYSNTEGSTSIDVSSAVAIDAAGDFLTLYSNGVSWCCLAFNIA